MHFLPEDCSGPVRHEITELSRFLTELSVCDYFFVTRNSSSTAIAAILTSMDALPRNRLSYRMKEQFVSAMSHIAKIQCDTTEIIECTERLKEMYNRGGYNSQQEKQDRGPSPDCVAAYEDDEAFDSNYNNHPY